MNKEKKKYLEILFILIAVLGIIDLMAFTNIYKSQSTIISIKDITESSIDQTVEIKGNITQVNQFSKLAIAELKDSTGEIEVICNCRLEKGKEVIIQGKVQKYENRLQIQAEKVQ